MWPRLFSILVYVIVIYSFNTASAQKKLVIMGSSTAAGAGASPGNSWAAKIEAFYRQNMADGLDTIVINLALGGYTTYLEMPTGFIPPPNRPFPDPNANVTKALSYSPDVVIINLPTNDIVLGYTKIEYMDNLRLMFSTINSAGARCFIATTQPRNIGLAERTALRELVDSINNNFAIRSINFWSDLVSPLTDPANIYTINPPVSAGDGIHINDLGHNYLFIRVRDKQIFASNAPLPLFLKDFQAQQKNDFVIIKWSTEQEDPNTFFEIQRSRD